MRAKTDRKWDGHFLVIVFAPIFGWCLFRLKNYSDQGYNRPRDLRLSAIIKSNLRHSKPPRTSQVSRGLRGAVNWAPIWPRKILAGWVGSDMMCDDSLLV